MPAPTAPLPLFATHALDARVAAISAVHMATALYTAEPIVDGLLAQLNWPCGRRRLLDPSCGDGMFLGRALVRYLDRYPAAGAGEIAASLAGWEFHPPAASQARDRLVTILFAHGWAREAATAVAGRIVTTDDFLTAYPAADADMVDVVAGNPPYLRMTHVPDPLHSDYVAALPTHASADLLHAFLDRCAGILREGGEMGIVTADRWLLGSTTAPLRAALGAQYRVDHLVRLDATTAFYRPKVRRAHTPPRVHPIAIVLRRTSSVATSGVEALCRSIRLTKAPLSPAMLNSPILAHNSGEPAHPSSSSSGCLGDIARIRLAPWLGPRGIFVIDAKTAASLPQTHLVPAIDTRDLAKPAGDRPQRFAIATSTAEPPSAILAHIRCQMHLMPRRGRRKLDWLPPEGWATLPLDQPALILPRAAKTLRPHRIAAGVLPLNHALHITPARADVSLDDLERILTSKDAQTWLEGHAAGIDNGYRWITAPLLRRLPVP